jgi:hypothetical protein
VESRVMATTLGVMKKQNRGALAVAALLAALVAVMYGYACAYLEPGDESNGTGRKITRPRI